LNQIKKGNLKKEKTEDEQYLEELKTKLWGLQYLLPYRVMTWWR
jgi:hypothetical protein